MQTEFRAIVHSEYGAPEKVLKIAKYQLNSEELDLLRQPVISVSDKSPAAVTASFIFAKKSAGDSVNGEAPTNNSSGLKGDGHGDPQGAEHAAKENFSGASIGREKVLTENSDQSSE